MNPDLVTREFTIKKKKIKLMYLESVTSNDTVSDFVINAIVNIICIIIISVRKKKDLPIKGWSITLIISLSIQLLILLVYFIAQFA